MCPPNLPLLYGVYAMDGREPFSEAQFDVEMKLGHHSKVKRETIELERHDDAWYSVSDRHVELFGTRAIPTPFLPRAKPEVVLAEIRRLNPGCNVQLAKL